MFKEVVSLAIILGFIWNVLFVEHPNKSTYTISFILSLLALSPFALLWRYWAAVRHLTELAELEDEPSMDSVSDVLGRVVDGGDIGLGADVEKALVSIDDGEGT
jgi:hypothetical protein